MDVLRTSNVNIVSRLQASVTASILTRLHTDQINEPFTSHANAPAQLSEIIGNKSGRQFETSVHQSEENDLCIEKNCDQMRNFGERKKLRKSFPNFATTSIQDELNISLRLLKGMLKPIRGVVIALANVLYLSLS